MTGNQYFIGEEVAISETIHSDREGGQSINNIIACGSLGWIARNGN
jgi:hypothetical protein